MKQPKPSRIQCAASQFVAATTSRSPRTGANYQVAISQFLAAGKNRADSVAATAFLKALQARDLASGSRATYISGARAFLKHLEAEGLIPQCPLHLLKRPRITRSMVNYLSETDAKKLIQCAQDSPTALTAVTLLLGLGLRVSEAVASQWRHLYQEEGRTGLLIPCGKGGKSRVAVVPPTILEVLQSCRRLQALPDQLDTADPSYLLSHGPNGSAYTRQHIFKIVAALATKAGIRHSGPHTLRHSFATLAARAGVQPYDLQESLGHQKLETTMFYVHLISGLSNNTSTLVANKLFNTTSVAPLFMQNTP